MPDTIHSDRCPDCGSDDLTARRYDSEPHLARINCAECGNSWREEA